MPFLKQATCGPTRNRNSLVSPMKNAPTDGAAFELHRAYYRPRVNPLFSSKEVARGPCDASSRWSQLKRTSLPLRHVSGAHQCCADLTLCRALDAAVTASLVADLHLDIFAISV